MRSIITPDNYPDWVYEELIDLACLTEWQDINHEQNIVIDIDDETGRAQVTVPVTVTATDREDVLEFLGRLSEYETGEDKEVD